MKSTFILSLFLFLSLILLIDANTQDEEQVRHRMNDLVDSVRDAVHEAESANHKKEVIDLGQTLHLLESKFSSLRNALSQELGAKSNRFQSHNIISKEIMDKNADLVQKVVDQREELRSLETDIKVVDSAIRALKESLTNFEKDIADLKIIARDLHSSTSELAATHDDAKMKLKDVIRDSKNHKHATSNGTHVGWYVALVLEIAAFVGFLYVKKMAGMGQKAYGKFG